MGRKYFLFLEFIALPLVSGCGGGNEPVVCTASLDAGIVIKVIDNASGNPASCGARAVITTNGYLETVENPVATSCLDTMPLAGAYERPGTYSITVSKAGYSDFTADNIVVTSGVCHVNTVTMEARLIAQ